MALGLWGCRVQGITAASPSLHYDAWQCAESHCSANQLSKLSDHSALSHGLHSS